MSGELSAILARPPDLVGLTFMASPKLRSNPPATSMAAGMPATARVPIPAVPRSKAPTPIAVPTPVGTAYLPRPPLASSTFEARLPTASVALDRKSLSLLPPVDIISPAADTAPPVTLPVVLAMAVPILEPGISKLGSANSPKNSAAP